MIVIAHRGSMRKGLQNTPAGVAAAAQSGADLVELDVRIGADDSFGCAHGLQPPSALDDCLAAIGPHMGLVAHLKGSFSDTQLDALLARLETHQLLPRVIFATHRGSLAAQLSRYPLTVARFGLWPALRALHSPAPTHWLMVNQLWLSRWLVRALHQRGHHVCASCLWELRSRHSVRALGVDSGFINLK